MKFTLKLQLDSASELATFIQDMNMEIDMPFLSETEAKGSTIMELATLLAKEQDENAYLKEKLDQLSKQPIEAFPPKPKPSIINSDFEKYLDENMPVETARTECPAIQAIQNHFTEAEAQPEPEAFEANTAKITETVIAHIVENSATEVKPARKYVCKPKPCADCGKDFVATHNTVKWCNDCRSKKVKHPTPKPH